MPKSALFTGKFPIGFEISVKVTRGYYGPAAVVTMRTGFEDETVRHEGPVSHEALEDVAVLVFALLAEIEAPGVVVQDEDDLPDPF